MVIVLSERSSVQVACIIYTFSLVLAVKLGQVCVSCLVRKYLSAHDRIS